jgi:hypothetical protein
MADYISNYANGKNYYFIFYSVVSGDTVQFPALLTQLDDKFSPSWNSQKVFGRQDPILTFQGTERTMDVAFDVPSHTKGQAASNLASLNKLINFLYPGFIEAGSANAISASPLLRIKFANLIYDQSRGVPSDDPQNGLVCGITNFSHSFKFDGSAGWVDEVGSAIPAFFSVSFSATILHTHDLGYIEGEPAITNGAIGEDALYPYYIRDEVVEQTRTQASFEATLTADRASGIADRIREARLPPNLRGETFRSSTFNEPITDVDTSISIRPPSARTAGRSLTSITDSD